MKRHLRRRVTAFDQHRQGGLVRRKREHADEHGGQQQPDRRRRERFVESPPIPDPAGRRRAVGVLRFGQLEDRQQQREGREDRRRVSRPRPRIAVSGRNRQVRDQRAEGESQPKRHADQRHAFRAFFQRRGIRDVGLRRGNRRARDAGADAGHEQQRQTLHHRGDAEQRVEHHRAQQADDQHRPAAPMIGQPAPDRSEHKLHDRETGHQQPQPPAVRIFRKVGRIDRHQRQHDAEPEQVDEDRQEDDQQRAFAGFVGHESGFRDVKSALLEARLFGKPGFGLDDHPIVTTCGICTMRGPTN